MSERATFSTRCLTDVSAVETAASIGPALVSRIRELTIYATFGAGTSAGAVVLEVAPTDAYTGTWATIATLSWSTANKVVSASVTGVHLAVRARISSAIVGGTVTVDIVGN